MTRFYINSELHIGEQYNLNNEIVRHINVLRIRANSSITLFNGNGYIYKAQLVTLDKRNAIVDILDSQLINNESNLNLTLAICLIANDKIDLVIQKTTELGINNIIPLISERSQRINDDRIDKRIEHWQKIIISSCEQSNRNILPNIYVPIKFNEYVKNTSNKLRKFILSPHMAPTTSAHSQNLKPDLTSYDTPTVILIGPEGGFTENEIIYAINHNFNCISFGPRILRAETAAISAITYMQIKYGDL